MTPEERSAVARKLREGMVASAPGVWEFDGDRYIVEPSGNWLSARGELSGEPVDPRWVISRGRRLED